MHFQVPRKSEAFVADGTNRWFMGLQHVIFQLFPRHEFLLAEFADRSLLVDFLNVALKDGLR